MKNLWKYCEILWKYCEGIARVQQLLPSRKGHHCHLKMPAQSSISALGTFPLYKDAATQLLKGNVEKFWPVSRFSPCSRHPVNFITRHAMTKKLWIHPHSLSEGPFLGSLITCSSETNLKKSHRTHLLWVGANASNDLLQIFFLHPNISDKEQGHFPINELFPNAPTVLQLFTHWSKYPRYIGCVFHTYSWDKYK